MNSKKPCEFFNEKNSKIILFGDSHAGSLSFDLYKKLQNKDYNFITTYKTCFNFRDVNYVNRFTNKKHKFCNNETLNQENKFFKKTTNSIVIIAGRFPLYLTELYFDNKEGYIETGGKEGNKFDYKLNKSEIENSLRNFVSDILKNNNKVIIVYPIPEVGYSVPNEIIKKYRKKGNEMENDYLTTSYSVYVDRTKSSFNLLDSLINKNIYRVYPHKLFCNTVIKE